MSDEPAEYEYDGISSAGLLRAASLVWPRWREVRGCVLRDDVGDPEAVAAWLDKPDGSVAQTEWVLNHVHLYDVVEEGWDEPEELFDERLKEIAHRMADGWAASLAIAFPDRVFSVEVATPEEDHGWVVYMASEPGGTDSPS